jgi:hypothetical protein
MSMLVEGGIVGFDEVLEAFTTSEGVLESGGFCAKHRTGGAHCGLILPGGCGVRAGKLKIPNFKIYITLSSLNSHRQGKKKGDSKRKNSHKI